MKQLTYDQKVTLAAYKCFFGENYLTNNGGTNTERHIAAQKMCYLLKIKGIEIGDFDFSWNLRGPFSPGYLALLRSIDRCEAQVVEFYNNLKAEESVLKKKAKKIDELRSKLEIEKHSDRYVDWVEILGSLAFIARSMLPGKDFVVVNKRFVQEKSDFKEETVNREAWNLLVKANVLLKIV